MGNSTDFLHIPRENPERRPVEERLTDYRHVYTELPPKKVHQQASRCMDCGIPFCHSGCPLGNLIPDFNDAVYRQDWRLAYEILSSTNNFPEFTGRICPAPCESACVLGINSDPVAIEFIEKSIAEKAYANGWAAPQTPATRTGKRVAIVGSGPAGLAAAEQLNKAGHSVTVFERAARIGGLLRYGIPDFKLEKTVIDRKLALMEAAGIDFRTHAHVGVNVDVAELTEEYDALLLTGGSTVARDLPITGRELKGVHYAMEFLTQQNDKIAANDATPTEICAADKHVLVIGGGDTGADCVGTSNRQGAASVRQIELLTQPPATRDARTPWPLWPMQLRTSSSHEEGCERQWAILTKAFIGDAAGELQAVRLVDIEWTHDKATGRSRFTEIAGTERDIPCQLALLAIGFVHPEPKGLLTQLGVELDARGNVAATNYATSVPNVYAAGDMRRGQSLVVWAIAEGREAAAAIDKDLRDVEAEESAGLMYEF